MADEIRFVSLDAAGTEDMTLTGYAIRYGSESELLGDFKEVISNRALDDANMDDCYLLFNHNTDNVLANSKAGTLSLTSTAEGLYFRAELPDTTLGRDTFALVKRGDLKAMSFAMQVEKDSWDVRQEPPVRTVERISRVREISIVPFPAYSSTNVEAAKRSLDDIRECISCVTGKKDRSAELAKEAESILNNIKKGNTP